MKKAIYILTILIVIAAFTITNATAQYVQHCVVSDPTGSPLNIRSTPNGGKIVGKLKNGARVAFDTESGDGQDRSWALVWLDKKNAKPLGWVLREYLECE